MHRLIIVSFLLTSCTAPIVRDTPNTSHCNDIDCVIKEMDKLPQGNQSDRYPFMEGCPDTNLQKLKEDGKLDIAIMNPLLIPIGFYGYSYLDFNDYGGVKSCLVRYLPGFDWMSLKHELSHCQGYADKGIPIQVADYTDQQKALMEKENVPWLETSIYKQHQACKW